MNDPKSFYRELDAFLAQIGKNKSGKNFLTSIFVELGNTFGNDLHITDGCIYEKRNKNYVTIYSSGKNSWNKKIPIESPAIQNVLEHGSFIFDNGELSFSFGLQNEKEYIIPSAISVNSPEREWILVFGLLHGWAREEVTLFLNAVKTALKYRLFSDIIGGELQQAVEIQKSLLPHKTPSYEGYEVYGKSIPAELVGGDFYDYFNYDDSYFGIGIGDASGHGLPAALLVRDVVIGLRMGLASEYKLVHTIKKLNQVIQKSTYASNFVSLFLGEFEKDGHLFYINSGHPAPFIVSGEKTEDLAATGIVLGFLKKIDLHRSHGHLKNNSLLVMYTDGIIERENQQEDQFGLERLKNLVIENQKKPAREIVTLIYKEVFEFGHSKNWDDDATVVVIKRL
jgi:sigma-B regulation protein RsbU (phosphoserine phosphatase)